ncbi:8-oxoguanine DNA glycosylase OGG fold protein [Gordonia sp. MMO-8]|uniref:8-oxoguanine DNA glycosylase OGG fold protein n=1 Tax=Gordonia sp. MMO-8 TaxID=3127886 RepID=UPI003017822E
MNRGDEMLVVPKDCVLWSHHQPYAEAVLDDYTTVDLDRWNNRLASLRIPARVYATDADGEQIESGIGHIRRGDLEATSTRLNLGPEPMLNRLYLCAAWLQSHSGRGGLRRFPDVRDPHDTTRPFDMIVRALDACERVPTLVETGAFRNWSGWPVAPGVGHSLMSLYGWAIHGPGPDRPQLLDTYSAASLVRYGWMVGAGASQFSVRSYARYSNLIHRWAGQAGTKPEIVELWLNRDWQRRLGRTALRGEPSLW